MMLCACIRFFLHVILFSFGSLVLSLSLVGFFLQIIYSHLLFGYMVFSCDGLCHCLFLTYTLHCYYPQCSLDVGIILICQVGIANSIWRFSLLDDFFHIILNPLYFSLSHISICILVCRLCFVRRWKASLP